MKLKYVGARPIVSKYGVSFDETKPDKYTFLTPTIDILDALELEEEGQDIIDIRNMKINHLKSDDLMDAVKRYCFNLDELFEKREEKANKRIDIFIENNKQYANLTPDEETALFGNIKIMRNYYIHNILNEMVYNQLLHILADKIYDLKFNTLIFPIGINHGLVLSHLSEILETHKPSYDAKLTIEEEDGEIMGKMSIKIIK
ncbi:hypothetical protein MNB_SV-9-1719 [hydrothermal vent metagenome]|uniref:Uncharacterized protein n=1 Tax=hydrothermal vent metagenome TaxID=652676 RepID=A0A1W1CGY1_9ZZZZ